MPTPLADRMPRLNWLSLTPSSAAFWNQRAAESLSADAVCAHRKQHRQIVHGAGIALLGGHLVPGLGLGDVAVDADALLVEIADAVLRRRKPELGRLLVPFGGGLHVGLGAAAFGIARADLEHALSGRLLPRLRAAAAAPHRPAPPRSDRRRGSRLRQAPLPERSQRQAPASTLVGVAATSTWPGAAAADCVTSSVAGAVESQPWSSPSRRQARLLSAVSACRRMLRPAGRCSAALRRQARPPSEWTASRLARLRRFAVGGGGIRFSLLDDRSRFGFVLATLGIAV